MAVARHKVDARPDTVAPVLYAKQCGTQAEASSTAYHGHFTGKLRQHRRVAIRGRQREECPSSREQCRAPGAPSASPSPPPNGGIKAWLQVVGAFFFVFNTWGMANSFGVFQAYYETTLIPDSTASAISWIGSIQGFLQLFVGVFCGRAFDAGYFYLLGSLGIFLSVFGVMMTSLASEYWQLFLAQGLCLGLGTGCLFTPSIALVGQYFSTRRSLATGIAACGSTVGGIIYPIAVKRLIDSVGFPWAVRAMGFIMLGTLLFGFALLKPRLPPRKSGPIVDITAFTDMTYSSFVVGLAFGFLAFFIPFFYSESFALNIGVGGDLSFYLLSIMNAASMFGRILPTALADKIGNLNTIVPCAYISGAVVLAWISVKSQGGLFAAAVIYGFFSGSIMALPAAILAALSPSLNQIGTRIGMALTIGSIGVLLGSPIAGAILTLQSDASRVGEKGALDFSGALTFTGSALLLCAILMTMTRFSKAGLTLRKV
ncbi:Major facilitator superfamily (MFS) general transporter [Teratosphaeria destructans]|uniref:Major facilitator superfamily (MFS) general transporter n=1 Tax=Teratosphaeria destructans TaxID=418781 RepID=A0A9W7W0X6_9PEZI|nr:Major facilitator superfamily (MFS) general transporter [Teratosphaeria destructans]